MRSIHQVHPEDFKSYNTQQIRERFLLDKLVNQGEITLAYTHYDRMMVGAAAPGKEAITLQTYDELRSEYFLERRELGILNIGTAGTVNVAGDAYELGKTDCLYVGRGNNELSFAGSGAKFILFSCPAHKEYPVQLMRGTDATPVELGSAETANHRVINKYIYSDGLKSCQLVMGYTRFMKGSLWNTMPPHLHERRMETYFYFDIPEGQQVLHLMGEPQETRHIFVSNEEAVVSPSWSIHCGAGTASYSFIWAMAGENLDYTDQDFLKVQDIR